MRVYSTLYSSHSARVCVCVRECVCVECVCVLCSVFGSVSVCVFTFTSHVKADGVSCSVRRHVTDTCRHRVQRRAANRSLSRHVAPPSASPLLPSVPSPPPLSLLSSVRSSSPSPAEPGYDAAPDSEPRHRLYPAEITWTLVCFCHVPAMLFQLGRSRLTSLSTNCTTTTTKPRCE